MPGALSLLCECQHDHSGDEPGSVYFVSVTDGARRALVAGPYQTHQLALDDVSIARLVGEADPRAHWYAWGTCRTLGKKPGVLNELIAAHKADRDALAASLNGQLVDAQTTETTERGNKRGSSRAPKEIKAYRHGALTHKS